jgi:sec-independent protein translocase protein TatC
MFHDEAKPFLEHLEDLRWMLIKCVITLAVAMAGCLFYVRDILLLLQYPLLEALKTRGGDPKQFLFSLNPTDPLTITLQTGVFAGFILSCPLLLYFIGQFVLPALTPKERRWILPSFAVGSLLFVAGVLFCYYLILPTAVGFFIDWSSYLNMEARYPVETYMGFTLQMLVAFGLSFELPLVITILALLGLVSSALLKEYRRHAFVIILVFAACVTPTSDFFSLAMLAGPMYFLYEASIVSTVFIERQRRQTERLSEEGEL